MRVFILLLALLVASCSRPLTDNERAFLTGIHGDSLDTQPIRITHAPFVGMFRVSYAARPRTTCRELILPPVEVGERLEGTVAGMAGKRRIYVNPDWFLPDYVPEYPQLLNLVAAMFFAHEITHIWQFQNREITGYHPFRGISEHQSGVDPYLFDESTAQPFLAFGYEQQASIVEEYICCAALDPDGARTTRLYELLSEVMDPTPMTRPLSNEVVIPWDGAEIEGICS